MSRLSPALTWQLLRKTSSFIVRRNGVELNAEPNNLFNLNTPKYSGLANHKTVGLRGLKKGVAFYKKAGGKRLARPAKHYVKSVLNRDFRRVAKTIAVETTRHHYRPDLKRAALARWTKIHRSLKAKNAPKKKTQPKKATAPKPAKK